MGQVPDIGGYGDGPEAYEGGPGGGYHMMGGRFGAGYRFSSKFGGAEHYGQGGPGYGAPGYGYKQGGGQASGKGKDGAAVSPGGDGHSAESAV
jgi:hypothetical protein